MCVASIWLWNVLIISRTYLPIYFITRLPNILGLIFQELFSAFGERNQQKQATALIGKRTSVSQLVLNASFTSEYFLSD